MAFLSVIAVGFVLIGSSSASHGTQHQRPDRSQLDLEKSNDWSSRALGPQDGLKSSNRRQHVHSWDEPDRPSKAREDPDTVRVKIVQKVLGSSKTRSETVVVEGDDEDQRGVDINGGLEPEEPLFEPEEQLDPRARSGVANPEKGRTRTSNSNRPQGALCWIPDRYKPYLVAILILFVLWDGLFVWLLIRRFRTDPKYSHLKFGMLKSGREICSAIRSLNSKDTARLSDMLFFKMSDMRCKERTIRKYFGGDEVEGKIGTLKVDVLVAGLRGRRRVWRRGMGREYMPNMRYQSVDFPSDMELFDDVDEEERGRGWSWGGRNTGGRNTGVGGMLSRFVFRTPPPPPARENI